MTGFEIGLFSVVAILILIYAGLYIPVALGLLTPPLGIACYVIKATLADEYRITLYDIFAGAFPLAVIMLAVLILLIAFPSISLILV